MRVALLFVVVSALCLDLGCATSPAGSDCDPGLTTCACTPGEIDCPSGFDCVGGVCEAVADGGGSAIDAAAATDAGPVFDAAPKKGFGELCGDKAECASNICILVGIGGICTETCVGNSCPTDYGCFGVFGAIEPGQVADVCVPESNQLCTVCAQSTECAIVGMDQCLGYDNGKKFCSRDCSTVECPTGYGCQDVDVGGTMMKQCIPASGACDCNAMLIGATDPCIINTPFGTCNAARSCAGASGWSACLPPSATDTPDATFTDDNCDGIDGDMAYGIFVANSGTDSPTCGLTYLDPCATVNRGILRAAQTPSRGEVYVQAGVYPGTVVLVSGVNVYGGYDTNWQRAAHTTTGHTVFLTGGLDNLVGGDNEYLAVRAHGLIVPTLLADVRIEGPNASGTVGGNGRSSYAVHVSGANVSLTRVTIVGGNGAAGATGSPGADAGNVNRTSAMNGKVGGNADESLDTCDSSSRGAAGAAGTNNCTGGTVGPNGGAGGVGGTMDKDCGLWSLNFNAQPGSPGADATWSNTTFGKGGTAGPACGPPGGGSQGRAVNGAAGTRSDGGLLSAGYWWARAGGAGAAGDHGSGGGGGGGSGGCDDGIDSYGAGGGGGGAGGCRAQGGGGGGGGGGGSFGIFVVGNAQVEATNCAIVRGLGGAGGAGGSGGRGQSGGLGGSGGLANGDSKAGGLGAIGGHGGHGGGGAGGYGGRSVGVFIRAGATVNHDCTYAAGASGEGGAAGSSAPTAPVAERDGNSGEAGAPGGLAGELLCTDDNAC